jgi:acetylornithine/succinyldiaminopimelate/putrescine aminotransferase
VAEATLDVLADGTLLADVEPKGRVIAGRIRDAGLEVVREVRQIGLMIGIQLRTQVRPYLQALQDEGVLALAAGSTVLRLLPPLVISVDDAVRVAEVVVRVLARRTAE